jgi:hypothetical protein
LYSLNWDARLRWLAEMRNNTGSGARGKKILLIVPTKRANFYAALSIIKEIFDFIISDFYNIHILLQPI